MLNKIRDFIFEKDNEADYERESAMKYMEEQAPQVIISAEEYKSLIDALGFYCDICKRGFETKHGASGHKRYKHA